MSDLFKIDNEQKLYFRRWKNGQGYSCMGFEYLESQYRILATHLVRRFSWSCPAPEIMGTDARFHQYEKLLVTAKHLAGNAPLDCFLTKQFIGLEGKRVSVTDLGGATRRFIVGKSTGWLPIHLELKTKRSRGGDPAQEKYSQVVNLGSVR